MLKCPYVSHAHTRFLCVQARSPHPTSRTTVHAQKWKIWLPGWTCATDSEKNGWFIGKEGMGQKVTCSHLYHILCPCLCHSFPHFGRNNSNIYSWVILELLPLPHIPQTPSLVVFLPLLIHFRESIHTRGVSSTSLWLQTRFLWRKLSLKPCSSTKAVLESPPEGGQHHQPVFQCTADTFLSESFTSHVQRRHSTQTSKLYLIKNKSCEPHKMELWEA